MLLRRLCSPLFALSLVALACASACTKDKASAPANDRSAAPDTASPSARAPKPELPDAAELLAAHVDAAGGADKVAAFDSLHAKGTVAAPGQKLHGTMEMWWQKGGKFYLEQTIEGVGRSRVGYDGHTIWVDDPITGLRILQGKEAASYIQTSLMFLGLDWAEHFSAAKTLGKRETDAGEEVWEVELESKRGVDMTLGLDTETKLIRYIKTTQITPMGPMPIEAHSEDYQDLDGYRFSMKKRSSIKGLIELQETIETLEANVEVDERLFLFPATREQVAADPRDQPPVEAPAEHSSADSAAADEP